MIEIKQITVGEFFNHYSYEELKAEYSEECRIHGMPIPKPDYDLYKIMENAGYMSVYGAFDGTDMVGFTCFLVSPNPHYSVLIGTIESIFVLKEHRKSKAGLDLLRTVKAVAVDKNVHGIFISAPASGVFSRVLQGMGLPKTNDIYFMEVASE